MSWFCSKPTGWIPRGRCRQAPRAPISRTWDLRQLWEGTGRPTRLPGFARPLPGAPCSALFWKVPCAPLGSFRAPSPRPSGPSGPQSHPFSRKGLRAPAKPGHPPPAPSSTLGDLEQLPQQLTPGSQRGGVPRLETGTRSGHSRGKSQRRPHAPWETPLQTPWQGPRGTLGQRPGGYVHLGLI